MRDGQTTNDEQLKIELLSQWKLEAESRNIIQISYLIYILFIQDVKTKFCNIGTIIFHMCGNSHTHKTIK